MSERSFSSSSSSSSSSNSKKNKNFEDDSQKVQSSGHGGGSSVITSNKMLSEQLRKKIASGPRHRRKGKARTTVISVGRDEFGQKVQELTGMKERKAEAGEKKRDRSTVESPNTEGPIPQYLKGCILYCSLFPRGYEFDHDKLVQLWIAEGLIEAGKNELMEDVGSLYFDYLLEWKFVVSSGFDHSVNGETYKVGDAMASLLEKEYLGLYHQSEDGKLADVSILSRHLSLICEDIDEMTFEALKKCRNLRTLLLLRDYGSSVKQVPRDVFLSLEYLRVLDLSRTHISELPSSVGNLKSLRYLDISETPIKWLPVSIDCLDNLQTLRLRGCLGLIGLPKCMYKLNNLRHLDLDVARQLRSMPIGMGNLTSLQTLRAFLVGKEDGCHIGELKNLNNLSGSFCISRLENVLNKEVAMEAALSNKQYLNKLELRWRDLQDQDEMGQDEDGILECLQPHFGLKELQIIFYNGSMLPSWISNPSFADLVSVTLYKCRNFHLLPSLGELPSLKFLRMVEMNRVRDINRLFCRNRVSQGYHAFPKLEKLTLDGMLNLEEWTGVEYGDFPCLIQLEIKYCPKLIALPLLSHLNSLKHLEINHCPELPSLPNEGLSASLEFLIVRDCPQIKERCRKGDGEDWFKIAHVASIWIDHEGISLN